MITLVTFPIAGFLAWLHFEMVGRVVFGPLTVFRLWYLAVLLACLVDILRHRDRELRSIWALLALSYLASFMTWDLSTRPPIDHSLRMVAVAGLLLLISTRTAVAFAACLHAVVVLAALAAYWLDIIPTHLDRLNRPNEFLMFSFPDISAGLLHASLLVVALSAGMGSSGLGLPFGRSDRDRPGRLAASSVAPASRIGDP